MTPLHFYAEQHFISNPELDHYNRRGVALGRDAAHKAIQAMYRDANEHEHRGGDANLQEALELRMLARNIGKLLIES